MAPGSPRKRTWLVRSLEALGVLALFVVAVAGGAWLHLGSPLGRRFVVARVNVLMRSTFKGEIVLESFDRLSARGASGLRVLVRDPEGIQVVYAEGVAARVSLWGILSSALGHGALDVALSSASVERADVNIDVAPDGRLGLERAFELWPQPASSGPGVRLSIGEVSVERAWVHGQPTPGQAVDLDAFSVRGAVLVTPETATIDLARASVALRGLPRGATALGEVSANVETPLEGADPTKLRVEFAGLVAAMPALLRLSLVGSAIDATLDVPGAPAELVRAVVPEAPIQAPLSARLEAHGELATLAVEAHATLGDGAIAASGFLGLAKQPWGYLAIDVKALDPRAFSVAAPAASLGGTATVFAVSTVDGGLYGDFTVLVAPGTLMAESTPGVRLKGDFTQRAGDFRVDGKGTVAEPGAPTELAFDVHPRGDSFEVLAEATTRVPDLRRVKRLGALPEGAGTVHVKGRILVPELSFDATVDADAHDLVVSDVRVASAHVGARARGTVAAPTVDFDARSGAVSAFGKALSSGTVRGRARLSGGELLLSGLEASLAQGASVITVTAPSATVSSQTFEARDIVLTGLGEPLSADVRRRGQVIALRATSRGIDGARVAQLLSLGEPWKQGRLTLDVDLVKDGAEARGHVTAELKDFSAATVQHAHGTIAVTLEGRHVDAEVHASLGNLGQVSLVTKALALGAAGPFSAEGWTQALGAIAVQGQVDLSQASALFPPEKAPWSELRGQVALEGAFARAKREATPDVSLSLATTGLFLGGRAAVPVEPGPTTILPTPPWRSSGLEAELGLKLEGAHFQGSARLSDAHGAWASLTLQSEAVPWASLLALDRDAALARLETLPLEATLEVQRRKVEELPTLLGALGATGEVDLRGKVKGTALTPVLELDANASSLESKLSPFAVPLFGNVRVRYEAGRGTLAVKVRTKKAQVLDGSATVQFSMEELLHRGPASASWEASTQAHFTAFPLGAVAALADRQVQGKLTGDVALLGLHKEARANLLLRVDKPRIGGVKYENAVLRADLADGRFATSARIEQTDGFAEATFAGGLPWGAAVLPDFAAEQALKATIKAKHFRAAAVGPFVDALSELDGLVDADASLELAPSGARRLQGNLTLTEGLFEIAGAGGEFHGVKAKASLNQEGILRVEDVVAYGLSGKVMANATGRTDGLRLVAINAALKIPKGQAIPLNIQGTSFGEVDGDLDVRMTASTSPKAAMNVALNVPTLHVQLPLGASSHALQDLDEPKHVHVGVYRDPKTFATLPIDGEDLREQVAESPQKWVVAVKLGDDVVVQRGTDLKIYLTGAPTLSLDRRAQVAGQIQLTRGTLMVQGKKFTIERGTLSFVGRDPGNPNVVVTAAWTAPDGTIVYADFLGPLKTGKVTLRSEPARPNNEVLALILFGTADGSASTPYATTQADDATRAGTAAGGFATEGLSRGLDDLTGLDFTARIDTTHASTPRPELELQIARDISVQVAFVLGTPAPGENPDKTFATIDWRFLRNWSLQTTVGDQGSSIADVLWRRRY